MNVAVVLCCTLQAAVVIIAPLAKLFGAVPLNAEQWLVVASISVIPLIAGEAGKIFADKKKNSHR